MHTFLWHDYETFGVNTRSDRPAQFAAIRTDADLNEIGEPMMCYCQPAPDYLPDPQSCLITGITPQTCLTRGVTEAEFAAQIEAALSEPNTIGVGYNTIRFDDEITRFLFWRNLIDPYAREWQNGCGRWDILDVVRAAYALRPDGINWPTGVDGRTSFRLELLTAANHISHEAAHDALSDVRATIALAKLIRDKQPKLFDFCFKLHKKDAVTEQISLHAPRPFVHISGMIPVEQGCVMIAYPLAQHPTNKNETIVWDCAHDPGELATLDVATLRTRLFSKADALPAGVTRLPIKSIHINKSPIVSPLNTLSAAQIQQWGLDMDSIKANAAACQMLGRTEAEVIAAGRTGFLDMTDPRSLAAIEQRRLTGTFSGELTFLRKNGTRFPADVSVADFVEPGGAQRGSVIFRDITQRKIAEERLLAYTAQLNAHFKYGPVIAYSLIPGGGQQRTRWVSENVADLLGFSVAEALAPDWWDRHVHPE
ncbi:MAG: exodeoxyribonuclease I, partial [Sphingopyxis sp.]